MKPRSKRGYTSIKKDDEPNLKWVQKLTSQNSGTFQSLSLFETEWWVHFYDNIIETFILSQCMLQNLTQKILHCTLFAVASGYKDFFRKSKSLKLDDQYSICNLPRLSRHYNINQKFSVIKWVLIKHITLPRPVCRANALIAMY